jgi:hydrogenase/urease accessory protein HupE
LRGREIRIDGLTGSTNDVLVRLESLDGSTQVKRLTPNEPAFTVAGAQTWFDVAHTYFWLGVGHILTGVDHLLFVLALIMIVPDRRRLIVTITAFTIAHSISLALATLQVVHFPGPPVEATIALSIVFVAAEILRRRQGHEGLAVRKPWIIAFSFGLLHGLGFAGALAEVGLPQNAIPLALLCFNVGVEIGQLLFIVLAIVTGYTAIRTVGALVFGSQAERDAVMALISGPLGMQSWVLRVGVGFVLPLVLLTWPGGRRTALVFAASCLILVGVFVDRLQFVTAGQITPVTSSADVVMPYASYPMRRMWYLWLE